MTPASDQAARTTGASLLRGGAWTAVSSVVPQLYTVALSIAAARFLGPSDFGRQSFIAFVAISIHLVLTSGIGLALMRSVAETLGRDRPDQALGLVAWAWRLQVVSALIGGAALVVVAVAGAEPAAAWALAGAFVTLAVLQSVANAVLLGAQRYRSAALIGLVTGGLTVPVTIVVLAAGGGIAGIFAVEAVVAGANLIWAALIARRVLPASSRRVAITPVVRRATLRFAGWTTATALVTLVVWRRSEFLFLAHYSTDVQIGLYSIGFAAVSALATLPERLSTVLVPAFATLRGASADERIRSGYSRSLRLLLIVSFPLTAGAVAVGPALLRVVYGHEYRDAGAVLTILAAVIPFTAVSSVASALLSGLDDARTPLVVGLVAAVVNVGLAFALIPRFDAVGAAAANVGAQAAGTVALYVGARRFSGPAEWRAGSLLRCALAATGCGLASRAVLELVDGGAGIAVAIPFGAAVFLALAVGLRVLSVDDADWLDGHLGHHLGGRVGALARRAAWSRPGAPS
jgi:O-antigen/teichoic acid export membrane protein